jgi:hypothetical protein
MDQRQIVVEDGLDERAGGTLRDGKVVQRTRHARTRFVTVELEKPVPLRDPEVGDRFDQVTVRARLIRFGRVWRRVPHTPDTRPQRERSCMPEPKREIFKDMPAVPMRLPVPSVDMTEAVQVLDAYLPMHEDAERKALWWAVADKESDREMGKRERCHHATAGKRKLIFLEALAKDWNERGWRVSLGDVVEARKLLHRNF